ncbi:hypothetical protein PENTCL1PPCAC_23201, partial [Pristionchus entomophagus]
AYPTEMSVDHRGTFFDTMRIIGEGQDCSVSDAQKVFFNLFELHRERADGVITEENLTKEEKEIVHSHLLTFILELTPRKYLSGMVVFRLEILPVLYPYVEERNKWKVAGIFAPWLVENEHHILCVLGVMIKIEEIVDFKHALHKHPRWHGDFSIALEVESNYSLTD